MRIDYSEPKKAYVTPQGKNRPRREPAGLITTIAFVAGVIIFIGGFGTGWFFSQKSAKKAYQAAMEQKSLENSPKNEAALQAPPPQPAPQPSAVPQPPPQSGAATAQTAPAVPGTPESPLSFYKTLPSGQKSNVLGSGINARDDKGKQPLQAAIPSNLTKPAQPVAEAVKAPVEKRATTGFTVQVASFSLRSEAEVLKNKLAGKGYNTTIVESNQGDNGTWYRVRVGKGLEQDAARELAGKFGKSAIVIPE